MAVKDGNPVNDAYTNSQLASKKEDNTLEGIQSLQNTDLDSGAPIANLQKSVNENIQDIDALETTVADHETRITQNESDIEDKIDLTEKGSANGVATLDASGLVPSNQLPSYVDDVLEFADVASFPVSGETGKIYIDLSTSNGYRWTGSIYALMSSGIASTDDLLEGSTNLYHTEARVNSLIQAASIGDLSNVDTSVSPTDGQVLAYNNVSGNFEPADQSGGGTSSGFNLETDPYAQKGVGLWTLYNSASEVPTTLSGGTVDPAVTFDTDKDSLEILAAPYNGVFRLNLDASNRQGHGVSKQFQIGDGLRKEGYVKIFGRYISDQDLDYGDVVLYAENGTSSEIIKLGTDTDGLLLEPLKANKSGFFTAAIPIDSNQGSLFVSFHNASSKAIARSIRFSDIKIDRINSIEVHAQERFSSLGETLTVHATSSNPVKGSSIDVDAWYGQRIGNRFIGSAIYDQIGTSGSNNGNGDYLFSLPKGYTFNNSFVRYYTGVEGVGNWINDGAIVGYFTATNDSGSDPLSGVAVAYDSTRFRLFGNRHSNAGVVGHVYFSLGDSGVSYSIKIDAPINEELQSNILNEFQLYRSKILTRAFRNLSNQSVPDSSTTKIEFNATNFDDHSCFDLAGNRFVAKRKMKVKVNGQIYTGTTAASASLQVQVKKNGNEQIYNRVTTPGINNQYSVPFEGTIELEKNQYIELEFTHNTGSSLDVIQGTSLSYIEFEEILETTNLGCIKSNESFFGVYDLTVTGNNGWSTSAAKGIVRKEGDYFTIEMQIEGTSNSTNQVDLTVSDLVGHPDYNYQTINAVGAFSAGQATNGGFRKLTEQIELRTSSNDTTWNCNGKIFLESLPAFVGA